MLRGESSLISVEESNLSLKNICLSSLFDSDENSYMRVGYDLDAFLKLLSCRLIHCPFLLSKNDFTAVRSL